MITRLLALTLVLGLAVFVGSFIWMVGRTPAPREIASDRESPSVETSQALSDGRVDVRVYALGNLDVRLEIQFTPNADAKETADMRPNVNVAMAEMHMDGFDPPLERVEPGVWRANLELPMAGRWVVNVGFGDEFSEIQFDAR